MKRAAKAGRRYVPLIYIQSPNLSMTPWLDMEHRTEGMQRPALIFDAYIPGRVS